MVADSDVFALIQWRNSMNESKAFTISACEYVKKYLDIYIKNNKEMACVNAENDMKGYDIVIITDCNYLINKPATQEMLFDLLKNFVDKVVITSNISLLQLYNTQQLLYYPGVDYEKYIQEGYSIDIPQ